VQLAQLNDMAYRAV
jgi:hypothetical protein